MRNYHFALLSAIMILVAFYGSAQSPASAWQYKGPRDLPSLVRSSSAIVLAEVLKLTANYSGIDSAGGTYYAGTVFQINVISYVKSSGSQTVYVTDAPFPSGDSMVSVGQRYVLFVSNDWRCAPSPPSPPCASPPTPLKMTYLVVGGPQGKFLVVDGKVYGYKSLFPDKDNFLEVDANGIPLDDFLSGIRNEISSQEKAYFMVEVLPIIIFSAGAVAFMSWLAWHRRRGRRRLASQSSTLTVAMKSPNASMCQRSSGLRGFESYPLIKPIMLEIPYGSRLRFSILSAKCFCHNKLNCDLSCIDW